jgi:hypothetical protein
VVSAKYGNFIKYEYKMLKLHPLTPLLVVSAKYGNFIKSQYEMLKKTQCEMLSISAFNAQGSRGIIVVVAVKVGAVKIYVVPVVEALKKKERQDET